MLAKEKYILSWKTNNMSGEMLGFNTWTKNKPQPYLELYVEAAEKKHLPIVALVDDVLTSVVFNRSEEENQIGRAHV